MVLATCYYPCLKPEWEIRTVEDAIHDRQIQTNTRHNGFEQKHPDWPGKDDHNQLVEILFLELDRRNDIWITSLFSQPLSFFLENDWTVSLRHKNNKWPCTSGDDQRHPISPSPGDWRHEPGSYWPNERTESRGSHKDRDD